jgi:uncharacterized membrane protein
MEEFSKKESLFFAALVLAIIVVAVLLVFLTLLSKPVEPYTELYFLPNSLPAKAMLGAGTDFVFFVENHEGMEMDYSFKVLVGTRVLDEGNVTLHDGEKKEFSETVSFSNTGMHKVVVELENKFGEEYNISFWVKLEAIE